MTTLFLLPHQDDEFGCFPIIRRRVAAGDQIRVVYLTDGQGGRALATVRDRESAAVLASLGVSREAIWFLGSGRGTPDQHLSQHLLESYNTLLANTVIQQTQVIYVPAWEGGHPDHDAAALLALALGQTLGIEEHVHQFPLYNAYKCGLSPFKVFNPIEARGKIESFPLSYSERLRNIRLCCQYPSQWKTFLAVMPMMVINQVRIGRQFSQELRRDMVAKRPHPGPLLYERRGWLTWGQFEQDVVQFRTQHNLSLC